VTGSHRRVAQEAADQLVLDDSFRAIALYGSVARGTERPDSDVDLLAVSAEPVAVMGHLDRGGLDVEILTHTADQWLARLQRPMPQWAHAWAAALILHDADGSGRQLQGLAREVLTSYQPSSAYLSDLAVFWRHVRPKFARSLQTGDDLEIGHNVAVISSHLVNSLFAVNSQVAPPESSSTRVELLRALTLPADLQASLRALYASGWPADRGRAALRLIDEILVLLVPSR
jgi:Nucleotidyltransferase domain